MEQATPFAEKVLQDEFEAHVHAQLKAMGVTPKEIKAVKKQNWVHIFCDGNYSFRVRMKITDSGKRIYKTRK